ncbi:UNVERIFIED_CONTAM: hypothetical protein Scaly_0255900 [Sesamum calycinum]|uniref:Gag-pol polyprotein n=1 Tax=Sesamum calycinum TaxID=2727403 RepID=A0AAW2S9D4_9LAMI
MEKLKDLNVDLEKETYIDVILQSLPPSFNLFIVNYNMNRLKKSINELISMFLQYEVTTENFASTVLVGEALISRAKTKGVRRCKRKKNELDSTSASASVLLPR